MSVTVLIVGMRKLYCRGFKAGSFRVAVKRRGVRFTDHALWVDVRRQRVLHLRAVRHAGVGNDAAGVPEYFPVREYRASTSRFGVGQQSGSNRTPLGLHRIREKIGGGWPVGTAFKSRQPIGFTWKGLPLAPITHRILWLDGLEPGFNRGGGVDSHGRYIYIHGTGDEPSLGRPASCGCIHLSANDLIPLYDQLPPGTLVWISAT